MAEMPYPTRPPVPFRRARLARKFQEYRLRAGYATHGAAAAALGWKQTKVGKQERSENLPSPGDVWRIAEVYRLDGGERDELLRLLATVDEPGRATSADDALMGGAAISYEDVATKIRQWHRAFVPALVQTENYIRAMTARPLSPPAADYMDQIVRIRATRTRVLFRDDAPSYHAVVDESALRRPVCDDPRVMAEQVTALRDLGTRENITIQVVPRDAVLVEVDEAWALFDYDDDPPAVAGDGLRRSLITVDPATVDLYNLAWDRVTGAALSPEDSRDTLYMISKEWSR